MTRLFFEVDSLLLIILLDMSSLESALSFSVIKSVENISARWVLSYAVLFSKTELRAKEAPDVGKRKSHTKGTPLSVRQNNSLSIAPPSYLLA
jgi:hypothetical protein